MVFFPLSLFVGLLPPQRCNALGKRRIGQGDHLRRQQRCIGSAVDGHRRHRHARGHLNRGEQRVQTVQRGGLDRNADHRQTGVRGERACQVCGLACAADQRAVARLRRARGKFPGCIRSAVGGDDANSEGDLQLFEHVDCTLHGLEIAVAAHDDGNFLHFLP